MIDELSRRGIRGELRLWSRGVDRERFSPLHRSETWRARIGVGEAVPVVLFVGRLRREKGARRLADLLSWLAARGPSHRAVIVGDGPEERALRRRLPDARFLGRLDGPALGEAYASSDLFVQPSDTETFGNVTLEAMAAGLPVVGVDAPGSRSLIDPGISGLLVAAEDLAPATAGLLRDPARRRAMGARARERSSAYSWGSALDQLVDQYGELVD
jgi:glycosyltransferase involved in cell wall biosynthesis